MFRTAGIVNSMLLSFVTCLKCIKHFKCRFRDAITSFSSCHDLGAALLQVKFEKKKKKNEKKKKSECTQYEGQY